MWLRAWGTTGPDIAPADPLEGQPWRLGGSVSLVTNRMLWSHEHTCFHLNGGPSSLSVALDITELSRNDGHTHEYTSGHVWSQTPSPWHMGGPLGDPFHWESRRHGPLCDCSTWLAWLLLEPMLFPASTSLLTFPLTLLSLLPCVSFSDSCPTIRPYRHSLAVLCTGRFFPLSPLAPACPLPPSLCNMAATGCRWLFIVLELRLVQMSNRIFIFKF